MKISISATLLERATYGEISQDELLELIAELEAWRNVTHKTSYCVDTPDDMAKALEELETNQCSKEHKQFDDYKEFFYDCVDALGGYWPCAAPWDNNLRAVILKAIAAGEDSGDNKS